MRKRNSDLARTTFFEGKKNILPPTTAHDAVARIEALTRIARNTWFTLLGALVFVGITLMGVQHIDFYGINRVTKLPIVNVDITTRSFFFAAPILLVSVYGHLHLYLIRLWEALGTAPARIEGRTLNDAVSPWLVIDAALWLRQLKRRDGCSSARPLEGPATALNFLLTWGFGLLILGLLWWMSMPARTIWMTAVPCLALIAAGYIALFSLLNLFERMGKAASRWEMLVRYASLLAFFLAAGSLCVLSYLRTEGPADRLAQISIVGQSIVEKPVDWLPFQLAEQEFFMVWCDREGAICRYEDLSKDQRKAFREEWLVRTKVLYSNLRKLDWSSSEGEKPDFRQAILHGTFLAGAGLYGARMQGADLRSANMAGAYLARAQMQGADLRGAHIQGALLTDTQMQYADLYGAQMQYADLTGVQMQGARFYLAQMQDAHLEWAKLQGADLYGAQMQGASLFGAQMQQVNLEKTNLQRAVLSFSLLTGTVSKPLRFSATNLNDSVNSGGAIRFADLSEIVFNPETDFRNVFLDGSVKMTEAFRNQMGNTCQWKTDVLSDREFYAHWRGWLESVIVEQSWAAFRIYMPENTMIISTNDWKDIAPEEWRDVSPITPPASCEPKTGPMPGTDEARP